MPHLHLDEAERAGGLVISCSTESLFASLVRDPDDAAEWASSIGERYALLTGAA